MKALERFYYWNCWAGGLCIFAVAAFIFVDVVGRWLFKHPLLGSVEFPEIAFLVFTFLGLSFLENRNRQMRIDIIPLRLKGRPFHLLATITALLALAVWVVILWTGAKDWLRAYELGDVRAGSSVEVPSVIHLGFLVYGTFLACLSLLTAIVLNVWRLFSPKSTASASPKEANSKG